MASKQPSSTAAPQAETETRLQEALANLKTASDRHAAIVAVMSRLRVSPGERRLAQSEIKKVEHELHDARRALQEAQAAAGKTKVGSAR